VILAFDLLENWKLIVGIAAAAIVVLIVLAIFINKGKYQARYKRFYKKLDKTIQKKFNGNVLIEEIVNTFSKDNTNTYKQLKSKGKRKVKKYLEYYVKNLPELVFLKSFTSADKKKSQLVLLFLNELDKVVFRWDKSRKLKGLIKGMNKNQMLTTVVGYLYELPIHVHEGAPLRMTNHDNDLTISYDVVKNPKAYKRKQKEKKLTKKEIKAQAKIEALKQKRMKKAKR
jgi:hypothetical protein